MLLPAWALLLRRDPLPQRPRLEPTQWRRSLNSQTPSLFSYSRTLGPQVLRDPPGPNVPLSAKTFPNSTLKSSGSHTWSPSNLPRAPIPAESGLARSPLASPDPPLALTSLRAGRPGASAQPHDRPRGFPRPPLPPPGSPVPAPPAPAPEPGVPAPSGPPTPHPPRPRPHSADAAGSRDQRPLIG